MIRLNAENSFARSGRSGIALLLTLIILVVLSAMAYTLSAKVAAQRHRNKYLIDYQTARYGCDSAVRLAIARLEDLEPNLISRPNEPDFSDVFHFTQQEYEDYLQSWQLQRQLLGLSQNDKDANAIPELNDVNNLDDSDDINEFNDANEPNGIPGPYGPPWPLAAIVEEFQIGDAKVKIEIEDENAKFPLGWALLNDQKIEREKEVAFQTFFEWWPSNDANGLQTTIFNLRDQLEKLNQIETFQMVFENKEIVTRGGIIPPNSSARNPMPIRTATRKTAVTKEQQLATQGIVFSKLFHSSIIDVEALARPIIVSDDRQESVLKYMGIWGSRTININTAPRNVLEAAFTFGGSPEKIADEIIIRRKIQPFSSIEQLKQSLFSYSDSIDKCKNYITTTSTDFTLKITSVCGVAKVTVVVAAIKTGKNVKKVAIISS